jgi:hypothetical protein
MTALISLQQHSQRRRLQVAALLQVQEQTRSLSPQAPKTTATANSLGLGGAHGPRTALVARLAKQRHQLSPHDDHPLMMGQIPP